MDLDSVMKQTIVTFLVGVLVGVVVRYGTRLARPVRVRFSENIWLRGRSKVAESSVVCVHKVSVKCFCCSYRLEI